MEIRTLTRKDIADVTRVHLAALPDTPMSRLGRVHLARAYNWFMHDPRMIGLVATEKERIIGAVTVTPDLKTTQRDFTHTMGFSVIPRMMLRVSLPALWDRFCVSRFIATQGGAYPSIETLVVDPMYQHRGAGTKLVTHALRILFSRGVRYIHTDTLASNTQALAFYLHMGFRQLKKTGLSVVLGRQIR